MFQRAIIEILKLLGYIITGVAIFVAMATFVYILVQIGNFVLKLCA